jgi:hypothetical protein
MTSQRSLQFESAHSDDLVSPTFNVGSYTQQTLNLFVKLNATGVAQGLARLGNSTSYTRLSLDSTGHFVAETKVSGTQKMLLVSNQAITDTGSWHNLNFRYDSTQGTAANRCFLSIDAVDCTYSSSTYPGLNQAFSTAGSDHRIGFDNSAYFNGLMDLIYSCNGFVYAPSNFVSSSPLRPITFAGSYSNNGYLLDFENNASLTTLGYDTSGEANNWTLSSGFTLSDSILSAPGAQGLAAAFAGAGALYADAQLHSKATAIGAIFAGSGALAANAFNALAIGAQFAGAGALAADLRKPTLWQVGALLTGVAGLRATLSKSPGSLAAAFAAAGALRADSIQIPAGTVFRMVDASNPVRMAGAGSLVCDTYFYVLPGKSEDILARVKRLIPGRWFAWVAPIRDALLGGLADQAARCYSLITYARQQSRLATATGPWLDVLCFDFLRRELLRGARDDDTFRTIIQATILQERVTRAGMVNAVTALTGVTPWIFEPWNPMDAGGYGVGGAGYGVAGGWGSLQLPAQVFMSISRSGAGAAGVPNVGGYGTTQGGYGFGALEYAGTYTQQVGVTDDDIYQMIERTKPTGTIVWTQIGDGRGTLRSAS